MYLHLQNLNTNTNTNANAPSSSSVTARFCWFEFIFLSSSSFCICPICGSLIAGCNKSHVCQGKQKCLLSKLGICTAKFDIYVTSFVFSMLEHWTLNVQCSMFNVQYSVFNVQYDDVARKHPSVQDKKQVTNSAQSRTD